jgi:hypothetical protein
MAKGISKFKEIYHKQVCLDVHVLQTGSRPPCTLTAVIKNKNNLVTKKKTDINDTVFYFESF